MYQSFIYKLKPVSYKNVFWVFCWSLKHKFNATETYNLISLKDETIKLSLSARLVVEKSDF